MSSEKKSAWVLKSSSIQKPWGDETSWRSPTSVSVKTLTLNKGKRNSFKYNNLKDELLICASGKIKAYFGSEELLEGTGNLNLEILLPGMALAVQTQCPYRLEAVEDSIVLEVSTGHRSDSGTVRLHDDYGRKTVTLHEHINKVVREWFLT